jgi:hypothetical protein
MGWNGMRVLVNAVRRAAVVEYIGHSLLGLESMIVFLVEGIWPRSLWCACFGWGWAVMRCGLGRLAVSGWARERGL